MKVAAPGPAERASQYECVCVSVCASNMILDAKTRHKNFEWQLGHDSPSVT